MLRPSKAWPWAGCDPKAEVGQRSATFRDGVYGDLGRFEEFVFGPGAVIVDVQLP
jgi:hypothetical protein